MGSYIEVVLSFNFREDVPADVLACLSRMEISPLSDPGAPALPGPVDEPDDMWWPDADIEDERPAWQHDWSRVFGPCGQLRWNRHTGQWSMTTRFSLKTTPEDAHEAISWLGPFITEHDNTGDFPLFLGYMLHDYAPRPQLLWCRQQVIELEDTNPDDEWQWGSATPNRLGARTASQPAVGALGRLTVVTGLPGSGKTAYLARIAAEQPRAAVYDDFQDRAIGNDPRPMSSRYFGSVLQALLNGTDVWIADRRYVLPGEVDWLSYDLGRAGLGLVQIDIVAFDPDPEACAQNLAARPSGTSRYDLETELGLLARYAERYSVTDQAIRLPVDGLS